MKPLSERSPFRVGIAAIASVGLLAGAVVVVSQLDVGKASYSAMLESTGGLRVGEEVQVAGVGVGEVSAIALDDRQVRVSFTLDDGLELGADTTAEVKVATLLGTHYLLVSPAGDGELADDTIPLDQTGVPFNLQDVLDEAVPEIAAFDTDVLSDSFDQIADTLDASGSELGPALDGLRELSAVVADRSDQIGALLEAARQVTGQLNDSSGDVVELLRQADLILDTLRARRETLHALLGDLAVFGTQLSGAVEDIRVDISPTLRDLGVVIKILKEHDADLQHAVRDLGPSVRYFANATGSGPWLDQYTPGGIPDNLECQGRMTCQ